MSIRHIRMGSANPAGSVCAGLLSVAILAPVIATGQDRGRDQDDESRERLIRKTRGQFDDDVMSRILELMGQSSTRLSDTFDAGDKTQRVQQQVIKELQVAIRQAMQNMRSQRQSAPQGESDKRQSGEASGKSESQAEQSGDAGGRAGAGVGGQDNATIRGGSLREGRRQWGNLPPRDREEIIQGLNDESHDKYREQIDRYYEALSETDDEP